MVRRTPVVVERHRSGPARVSQRRYEVIPLDVDGVLHDMNDHGMAVGQEIGAGGAMRAVRVTTSGTADLGTLGGSTAAARGTNDAGAIVGGSLTEGDEAHHAFLYEAGAMHDLNELVAPELECELIQALAINNRGDILAIGHYDGADRVLLLTPGDGDRDPS